MDAPKHNLKARALRLLAIREYSRSELERKLMRVTAAQDLQCQPDQAAVAAVLDELQALGLLDNQRFAESLVRRRSAKYGARRIAQELQSHGLDRESVAQALDAHPRDEVQQAVELLRKRYPTADMNAQDRARRGRFLLARGFSIDLVRLALRRFEEEMASLPPSVPEDGA